MYPHINDRHHLIRLIYKALRKKNGWNQERLARTADLNQAVISAIETLPGSSKVRVVSRYDLIKAMKAFNLQKPGLKVNAALWLFDGNILSPDERREFKFKINPSDDSTGSKEQNTILDLLRQAAKYYKGHKGKCLTITSENEEDELSIYRDFLKIESGEGLRILMKRIPSSLTYPKQIFESAKGIPIKINSKYGVEQFCSLRKRRIENYLKQVKEYGDRCIHVEEEIKEYLSCRGAYPPLTKAERKLHIQNLILLLEEYPAHFQVRLVKKLPLFEYGMKAFNKVIVTAEFYSSEVQLVRYIELFGEEAVIPYLLEFENQWNEASKKQNDNKSVIDKLNKLIIDS